MSGILKVDEVGRWLAGERFCSCRMNGEPALGQGMGGLLAPNRPFVRRRDLASLTNDL